jgi:hypothetical protein
MFLFLPQIPQVSSAIPALVPKQERGHFLVGRSKRNFSLTLPGRVDDGLNLPLGSSQ